MLLERRGFVLAGRSLPGTRSPALEELEIVDDHLGAAPLLAVLAFPRARLQTAFHVDQRTLLEVLSQQLGQVSLADVPGDAVVVVGELAALAVRAGGVAVGRDAERRDRL